MKFAVCFVAGFIALVSCGCEKTETANAPTPQANATEKSLAKTSLEEIDAGTAVLVDVREQDEYDEKHFADAILIPMSTLKDTPAPEGLDKSVKIYTHCAKGKRAANVAKQLRDLGYDATALEYSFDDLESEGFQRDK